MNDSSGARHGGDLPRRRPTAMLLLAALLATLLWATLAQQADAKSGSGRRPYSLIPSTTMPYTPCPPGGRMIECNIVIDPPPVATSAGYRIPGVTQAIEGSGVLGGYSPADLQSAYSTPASGGSGQTVALIDAYGYAAAESDLAKYREMYGLEPCTKANGCFKRVNQKGEEANYPPEGGELENGWQIEAALDMDMVSAACSHCHILLVEPTTQGPKDTAASVEEAAKLSATEISNSYGYPENEETICPAKKGCAEYLSDYNHPGIPVTVSSGDSGYDNSIGAPSWPATSPNVIAVGGTSLRRAAGSRGWAETVWSGSGSGCSLYEAKPTWQTDAGCAKRTDNDVAAVANNETPVSVYKSTWIDLGGTSVAAPLIAAIEAHANTATRTAGAEAFYKKPGMLFDITEGSNGTCAEHPYLCTAGTGYDGPTGWGTPNGVFHLSGWASQRIPNLAERTNTKSSSLLGTSCLSTTECTAVGHYTGNEGTEVPLAEHWNGTAWSIQETAALSKSGLLGVSCVTVSCTAVGHRANASGTEVPLAERWNGSGWSIEEIPSPTGAKSASLSAVACQDKLNGFETSEECTAAGHYVNSAGTELMLVEHGIAGVWSIVETPSPTGAKSSALLGIACEVSPFGTGQACNAVGHYVNSTGTEVTLADLWLGGALKWTLQETPNPTGAKSSSLSSVSCPSGCTAVGHYVNSTGTEVTLAEHWVAEGKWTLQETPNPTGAKSSSMLGVSCETEEACETVGHYVTSGGVESTVAEIDSSKVWTVQEPPNPTGAKSSSLTGVSCTAAEACTAAGRYTNSSSTELTVAERWSSTKKWAIQETLTPKNASGSLAGMSCTTIEACTSTGHYLNSSGTEVTLAERWNGKEWALQETPNPTGAKGSALIGVSCKSSTSCIAVGRYINSSGAEVALAESWNGTTWTLKEPVIPTGATSSKLVSVSCASTTSCIAVGAYVNSGGIQVTLGESWNGTAWSLKEPVNPTGATSGSLSGVSCASTTSCIATGRYVNSGGTEVTLAESWNGTAWTLKEPLNPTGAKSSILIGVSCTSSTSCTGVGGYVNSAGAELTLAEGWNGTAWTIQETPSLEAAKGGRFVGVSCTSSTACMASGFSVNGAGLETAVAEEHS